MARFLIHPGEHLADESKALGMSANELAKELGVPTNRITEVIRGKRGISGDRALRLGWWFGTGPDIWMNLQKNYELRLAAQEIGDALQKIPQHRPLSVRTVGLENQILFHLIVYLAYNLSPCLG